MAGFIGNTPAEKYVSLETQNFTVTATASYTLSNAVTNENEIALFINNVRQQPGSSYAYTASGTTLTLSSATAGTDTMYCVYLGKSVGTINPPDGSVGDSTITAMSASKLTGALPAISGASLTNLPTEITKQGSDPTVSTNPSGGVGSVILNTSSGEMYCCTDATAGANIWKNIGDGTGTIITDGPYSASGGTTGTYTDNSISYKFHTFTSSSNLVISSVGAGASFVPMDILVIAGAGGGGSGLNNASNGAGGGAGGLRWFTAQTPTASTYTVTVGAGGSAATNTDGGMGTDSSFIGSGISITGSGGAGGNKGGSVAPRSGGSGAGATRIDASGTTNGGAGNAGGYTPVEGYAGGNCSHQSGAAGGGGSGGVGGNENNNGGGFGGPGEDNFLNQSSTAFTVASTKLLLDAVALGEVDGSSRHIAAGGGGGWSDSNATTQVGGIGGGGNGANKVNGTAATASLVNTGSGGGGGYHTSNETGSAGSSGVVIVRYRAS